MQFMQLVQFVQFVQLAVNNGACCASLPLTALPLGLAMNYLNCRATRSTARRGDKSDVERRSGDNRSSLVRR